MEHGAYRALIDLYYTDEGPLPGDINEVCRKICARTPEERATVIRILEEFFFKQEVQGEPDLFPRAGGGATPLTFAHLYRHKRCEEELTSYRKRVRANKNNGLKGGRPKAQAKPTGFQKETHRVLKQNPPNLQSPSTIPQAQEPSPTRNGGHPQALSVSNPTHVNGNGHPDRAREPEPPIQLKPPANATTDENFLVEHPLMAFGLFFEAYPKPVGKPAAWDEWQKIKSTDLRIEIFTGLAQWKACHQWTDERYIPNPAKFLKERRWADSPPKETNGNGRNGKHSGFGKETGRLPADPGKTYRKPTVVNLNP